MRSGALEITDLLWSFGAAGQRIPVVRDEVTATLRARGQQRAARIVGRMPVVGEHLDPAYVDGLGLRVHCELQRLGEELLLGQRVAELVASMMPRIGPASGMSVRVVDVGCGLGHVIRSIAARADLDARVELVGVDANPVLIGEARRLAAVENLDCHFVTANAFELGVAIENGPATMIVSTGLLHHLSPVELADFFAAQAGRKVGAFAHWDIAPCRWSTLGAWVFHQARMREAVSRHDGVLSARRAYPSDVLLAAARQGAGSYRCDVLEGPRWHPRALDVLRPIVGIRS